MKFEPSGMTNDPDIRFASSLVDYVFRRLALDYLSEDKREALGIRSIEERTVAARAEVEEKLQPSDEAPAEAAAPELIPVTEKQTARILDAPLCYQCGSKMQPAGSCYVCGTCGSTSGCS
jgi:ribonucleoside-diphosphate reductase alpha chain